MKYEISLTRREHDHNWKKLLCWVKTESKARVILLTGRKP